MNFNVEKYYPTEVYKRNNLESYLCIIRKRLIKKTPEEIIRQAFITYLIIEKKVPADLIEVEICLSKRNKAERKRADIIVYGDNEKSKVILVVECKKNSLNIIDRNIDQVRYYDQTFNSNCVVITNGRDFQTFKKFNEEYKQLSIIPSFKELRNNHSLKNTVIEFEPYSRHTLADLQKTSTHKYFTEWGHIGQDTPNEYLIFISNLIDFLFDKETTFEGLKFNGLVIQKDLGIVYDSFGNGAGGSWEGEYKKLLITDKLKNNYTIGIAILAKAKFKDHPTFGNSKGNTCLIVSIDDFEKSHNSLQLNLDKSLKFNGNKVEIFHDGNLTNAHKGKMKVSKVIDFIKKNANYMTLNDKILLGTLNNEKLIEHTDENAKIFIQNLITYAVLRDELRRQNK